MRKFLKITVISLIITQIMAVTAFAHDKVSNLNEMENSIYNHLENRDENFTILYTGNRIEFESNILNCIKEAYSEDDYLERSWVQIKPKAYKTEAGIETTLNVTYLETKEQEEYIEKELRRATDSIIKPNMSDEEKVKAINDYIINRYKYDYTEKSISVYSALTSSVAVCQGYSMTAFKMLNDAGIKNRIVVGEINGVSHSWNLVMVNGYWYQLDVTNNDSSEKNKYFLVDDDMMINNKYTWDRNKYPKANKSVKS